MMDSLRAATNNTAIKIILGLIVIAFTLSGVGGYLISGHSDYVAKVNGDEISRADYEHALANQRQQLQQQLGDNYSQLAANDDYMKMLRKQTLQQLIDQRLLEQYASKLHLTISDEQIKQSIFQEPAFQVDNKFDNARFNSVIKNLNLTPDQYASALRQQLTNQQLINSLTSTDFMLPTETDQLAALLDQQRVVREASIDVAKLAKQQQVSEPETEGYYQQHKNQFLAPEQFRVNYIELDATRIHSTVTSDEVHSYYQQHQDEFTTPREMRYSVIQTKTGQQAQQIVDELKKGADFAQLAKEKSTDIISAKKGGDLGWLTDATTPDELKGAGLTEKNPLSGVIPSSGGYLVARLDDSKPAQVKPFDEVQTRISNQLTQQQDQKSWYALQQKVSDAASNNNDSLNEAAQAAGVNVQQTDWFDRDSVPAVLNFPPVQQAIFDGNLLDDGGHASSNSDVINIEGDRAFVLRIIGHKPQQVKPLKTVHDQVTEAIKQQKALNQAQQQANTLLAQLQAGKGDTALSSAGLAFNEAQTVHRQADDPLSKAIFSLAPPASGKVTYGSGQDANGNIVLLALDSVQPGTMSDEQKVALARTMAGNKAQLVLDALVGNLRQQASIKVNQNAIDQ